MVAFSHPEEAAMNTEFTRCPLAYDRGHGRHTATEQASGACRTFESYAQAYAFATAQASGTWHCLPESAPSWLRGRTLN